MFCRRLIILVPHPDDEVVGCGMLLDRARSAGAELFTLVLTTGVPPRACLWPWERPDYDRRVAVRSAEFDRAREQLGAIDAGRLPIPARTLKSHLAEAQGMIERTLEAIRPDMMWVPAFEGAHQDHDAANFLGSLAKARVDVWEFSEYAYWGGKVRNNRFRHHRPGTITIALSAAEQSKKRKLLSFYESEKRNLSHVRVDCESVRPLSPHDYTAPPHPPPLFYQRFQWVPRHPRVDHCRPHEVAEVLSRHREAMERDAVPA